MRETITLDRGQMGGGSGELIALTIALVIAVTMISVLIPVVADNSGTVTVTNETVTESLAYNTTYELEGFDLVAGSETVYVENGSAGSYETLAASAYTLDDSTAEINFTSAESASAAGDDVLITYDYNATDSTVETILDLFGLLLALIALVALSGPIQRRL